jgi:glutamate-1-semialdehyde 2,1-aminomutase
MLGDMTRQALSETGLAGQVTRVGSLLTLFFTANAVGNYAAAKTSDTRRFASFFREMLRRGILLAPSQFEALFVSAAHTEDDIRRAGEACRESLAAPIP